MGRRLVGGEIGISIERCFVFPGISVNLIPFVEHSGMALAPKLEPYSRYRKAVKGDHAVRAVSKAEDNSTALVAH
jgi:hypothetical protein